MISTPLKEDVVQGYTLWGSGLSQHAHRDNANMQMYVGHYKALCRVLRSQSDIAGTSAGLPRDRASVLGSSDLGSAGPSQLQAAAAL